MPDFTREIRRRLASMSLAPTREAEIVEELSQHLGDRSWCNGEGYSLADIATGCALAYLDLRHPDVDWRGNYTNLVKLADKLAKRPSFAETVPPAGA